MGALVEKDVRYQVRQWDTKKVRTTCSYCGVGCQLNLHVRDNQVVKVSGVEDLPPNNGSLCVKGRFGYHFVNSPERLTVPLIRKDGELKEAHLGRSPGPGRQSLQGYPRYRRAGQSGSSDLRPRD